MQVNEIKVKSNDILESNVWKENYYYKFLSVILAGKSIYDVRDNVYSLNGELDEIYRYLLYNKKDKKAYQVNELLHTFQNDWLDMWRIVEKGKREKNSPENSIYKELRNAIAK